MDKKTLRRQALLARETLSIEEKQSKENQIVDALLPLLEGKKVIAIYLPKQDEKEVDVSSLLFAYPQLGVPKVRNQEEMDFFLISGLQDVELGHFSILEPTTNVLMEPNTIDCIVVPLVAFDENKHRIGHGKGYYDRYLQRSKAVTIGVAFACQKVDAIPVEAHDVTLDYIVTENQIYT